MHPDRRTLLTAGLAVLLGACANTVAPVTRGTPAPTRTPRSTATPTRTPVALPRVTGWQPSPADRDPSCKAAAVREVTRRGTGSHRVLQVIDAQYGGLLSASASVLVVTRSWELRDGAVPAGGRTYDVRLSRRRSGWRVDAVYPSRSGPAGRISAVARRVLADPRIDLPPAARRDVESGLVHDAPLAALLAVARDYRVGVSVIRSGHPLYVFGTGRLSDHPQGRAFDTWQIDGHAVVDPRTSRQLVTEYMHAVAAAGSYNVGGPYLLGPAPQWFSDDTHHDHVHAGFLG